MLYSKSLRVCVYVCRILNLSTPVNFFVCFVIDESTSDATGILLTFPLKYPSLDDVPHYPSEINLSMQIMPKYKLSRSFYRQAQINSNRQIAKLDNNLTLLNDNCDNFSEISVTVNDDYHTSSAVSSEILTSESFTSSSDDDQITTNSNIHSPVLIGNESNELNFSSLNNEVLSFDLQSQLAHWAVRNVVTHTALNNLLAILQPYHPSLPIDARTLLNTPRNLKLDSVDPGKYYHFGLYNAVYKLIEKFAKHLEYIKVCVNIDGLPIAKSSSNQLYPILCNLYDNPKIVEIIGLYQGFDKPKNANLFLEQFINEAHSLTLNGFMFNGRLLSFKIVAFICDAPAKSFITFTKGHTGYSSCSKCYIEGTFLNNRVSFPQIHNLKNRTDIEFRQKVDDDHHTGTSMIENIPNFDMIDDVVLDPMHLLHLGVMRKLLLLWVHGKPGCKLPFSKISKLSLLLTSLKQNIPLEFNRKPRSITELKRFKATEYRQLLFYTGPLVFKSVLPIDMYLNFMSLHVATTILSDTTFLHDLGEYAESLFKYFIETFCTLYGKDQISHNIHNLIHIHSDAKRFGVLENFSAYPFENYLQKFKNLIRKGDKPLAQIVKRIIEQGYSQNITTECLESFPIPKRQHSEGPLLMNITAFRAV